jgi:hypothetical protein
MPAYPLEATMQPTLSHTLVYRQPGRFAGWPANYGIWSWGEEVVVGFALGYHDSAGQFHARDRARPMLPMQARSLDGGRTWAVEPMPLRAPGNTGISADEHMIPALQAATAIRSGGEHLPTACPGGIDFTHPDFALLCARTGLGKGTQAWFYTSTDRCRSWQGPYRLPLFGLPGIEARTDYIVTGPSECLLFLTASKSTGGEGGGVFCARTQDGGKSFERLAWVTRSRGPGFKIMPSTVRMDRGTLVTAVRCQTRRGNFIDVFTSPDLGCTWQRLSRPAPITGRNGNPPALTRLPDGRLCLVYGYRADPPGLRARLSPDGGATWGPEIILRSDAGSHDIGYPRAVVLPGGDVLAVYYYADSPDGERYIAATRVSQE